MLLARSHGTAVQPLNGPNTSRQRDLLTVLIPCKNERANIRACIESVRAFADEVLIADSGSTDGTLGIVRNLGNCRIIQRDYVTPADFKNWAIPQAAHPWVFLLDADERVPPALADELLEVLRNPPPEIDCYRCEFQDYYMGCLLKHAGWDTASIRLIRRDACRFQPRRVHESILADRRRVGKLRTRIQHYSIWTHEGFINKYNRYTTLGAQELWDRGRRASFISLLVRPLVRFLHLYFVRRGFLDGLCGLQVCMLMSFFNTFLKQAKLWEMEFASTQPELSGVDEGPRLLPFPSERSAIEGRHEAASHDLLVEGLCDAA